MSSKRLRGLSPLSTQPTHSLPIPIVSVKQNQGALRTSLEDRELTNIQEIFPYYSTEQKEVETYVEHLDGLF